MTSQPLLKKQVRLDVRQDYSSSGCHVIPLMAVDTSCLSQFPHTSCSRGRQKQDNPSRALWEAASAAPETQQQQHLSRKELGLVGGLSSGEGRLLGRDNADAKCQRAEALLLLLGMQEPHTGDTDAGV